tara:strand:+ start:394 stop:552 length:159 start_codon:yes stop_codon:yes gene_type:complete
MQEAMGIHIQDAVSAGNNEENNGGSSSTSLPADVAQRLYDGVSVLMQQLQVC